MYSFLRWTSSTGLAQLFAGQVRCIILQYLRPHPHYAGENGGLILCWGLPATLISPSFKRGFQEKLYKPDEFKKRRLCV